MSLSHLEEYLQKYQDLCSKKRVRPVESIRKTIEKAVQNNGDAVDAFLLRGTNPDLKYSRIDDAKLETIITPLSTANFIRVLDLSFNEISNKGAIALAKFFKIGPQGAQALGKAFVYNTTVTYLDLSDNNLGEEGGMELAGALQVNTSLSTVLLSGCSISASALIALGTVLQSNNSVDRLDISNNAVKHSALSQTLVSNVMTHWGRALETNYGLKTLSFAKMGITDWTMCDFLAGTLHNNQNLTTLDLSCNKITRDGGAALCKALESHAALNNLKLSCCSLQDEGAEAISHLLQVNRKIRVLHLDYNKITGKGLAKIAQGIQANYSLVYIALWGNVWSVQACEAYLDLVGGIVSQVAIGSDNAAPVRRKGRLETDVVFYKVEGVLNAAHHETMQSIIPHQ